MRDNGIPGGNVFAMMANPFLEVAPSPKLIKEGKAAIGPAFGPIRQMETVPDIDELRKQQEALAQQQAMQSQMAQSQAQSFPMPQMDREYVERFKQYLGAREASAEDMKKALEEASARDLSGAQYADMSPILAYIDSTTGSKLTQGYNAPTERKDHQDRMQKIADMYQKESQGISDDQLEYLRMQGSMANNRALLEAGRDERFGKSEDRKVKFEVKKDFDKVMDVLVDEQKSIANVEDALTSAEPTRVMQSLSTIARVVNSEKGALSEGDVGRQIAGNINIELARIQNWVSSNPNQKVPPGVVKPLMDAVAQFKQVSREAADMRLNRRYEDWRGMGYVPEYIDEVHGRARSMLQKTYTLPGSIDLKNAPAPQGAPGGLQDPASWLKNKRGE